MSEHKGVTIQLTDKQRQAVRRATGEEHVEIRLEKTPFEGNVPSRALAGKSALSGKQALRGKATLSGKQALRGKATLSGKQALRGKTTLSGKQALRGRTNV